MPKLVVALFAIALPALVQSEPPPPTPTKSAQNNQRETTGKQDKTAEDQRVSDALSSAINQLSTQIAAKEEHRNTTPEKSDTSSDWWLKWSTIISAVSTFFIAVLAYRQWRTLEEHREVFGKQASYIRRALRQTKIAAAAASATARATAAEFELTHRPWISVAVRPGSNLTFDASGITLSVDYLTRNIGKSPAVKILMDSILLLDGNGRNAMNERADLCAKVKAMQSLEQPSAILPDGDSQVMFELHRNQNYVNDSMMPSNRYLSGVVITVVTYRSSFNEERLYSTSTIHRIMVEGKVTFASGTTRLIDTITLSLLPIQGTTIE